MEVAKGNEGEEAEAEKRKAKEKIDCPVPVPEKEDAIVLGNDGGVLEDPVVVGHVDGISVDGMSPQELDAFLKVFSENQNCCVCGHDGCMRSVGVSYSLLPYLSLFYRYKPLTHHSFFHTQEASTERKVSGVGTGAAVLGGVAGMVVLGPLGAVAGAGVLAYAATREDKVGETARSGGEVSQSLISN